MKAQRRHELQHNVLDQKLGVIIEFLKKHGSRILWGVLVLAILVFAWVWYSKQQVKTTNELWAERDQATGNSALTREQRIEILEKLAKQAKSKDVAALSCVDLGNIYSVDFLLAESKLSEAERTALADKATANFRRVISDYSNQKTAVAKAHLGLGNLAESRSDFDGARKEWEAAVAMTDLAGTPAVESARVALGNIATMKTKVKMASTAPSTQPTTTSAPATLPAGPTIPGAPATTTAPGTAPAAVPATAPAAGN